LTTQHEPFTRTKSQRVNVTRQHRIQREIYDNVYN